MSLIVYAGDELALGALAERLGLRLQAPGILTAAYVARQNSRRVAATRVGSQWPRNLGNFAERIDGITVHQGPASAGGTGEFFVRIPGMAGDRSPQFELEARDLATAIEEVDRLLPCMAWRGINQMEHGLRLSSALDALVTRS